MAEAGFPLEAAYWFGLVAPAGTPPAVIAKLEKALAETLAMPDVRKRLTEMGAVVSRSARSSSATTSGPRPQMGRRDRPEQHQVRATARPGGVHDLNSYGRFLLGVKWLDSRALAEEAAPARPGVRRRPHGAG